MDKCPICDHALARDELPDGGQTFHCDPDTGGCGWMRITKRLILDKTEPKK